MNTKGAREIFEEGMKVQINTNGIGIGRLETVLRGYTEVIARGLQGAYFQGGEIAVIDEIVIYDGDQPELVRVTFADGREDCVFVEWLDVLS